MQATHFGFIRFYLMATAVIPGLALHFFLYFPEPRPFILLHPRLQIVPYLVSLAILVPMLRIHYAEQNVQRELDPLLLCFGRNRPGVRHHKETIYPAPNTLHNSPRRPGETL